MVIRQGLCYLCQYTAILGFLYLGIETSLISPHPSYPRVFPRELLRKKA